MPTSSRTTTDTISLNMFDRAIALAVDKSGFGNSRTASLSGLDVDADKDMLHLSKKLIDAPELREIIKIDNACIEWLQANALPSFFKPGIYLVPLALVDKVDARLEETAAKRHAAVVEFLRVYPARVAQAKTRLRKQFNEQDYPSVQELRRMFDFRWRYLDLSTPTSLETISRRVFKAAWARASIEVANAVENVRHILRASMKDLVDHMAEKLSDGPDGKRRVFRGKSLERFNEFLGSFDLRNITDDEELRRLVTEARKMVGGRSVSDFKDNERLRIDVASGLHRIKARLDTLVTDAPMRTVVFDDL